MYQKDRNLTPSTTIVNNKKGENIIPCPARKFLNTVRGKFAIEVLEQIVLGNLHYGVLLRSIPDINSRILSARLHEFVKAGILHREVFPTNPPQVEYTLTEKGKALKIVFTSVGEWIEKYENN